MPIKPENKGLYPKEWKQIRAAILNRAQNKCEQCQAPNHKTVWRGSGRDAGTYMLEDGEVHDENNGEYLGMARGSEYCGVKFVRIVITISHLDHMPENCEESNLKALCQKCHLKYDAELHITNAAITRRNRRAVRDLFAESVPSELMGF